MIESEFTEKAVPHYEKEIADFLSSETFHGEGSTMIVAVENEQQEVYRVIKASGFGDFMSVIECLSDIGLIDILESSLDAVGGFDARFRFSQETI